MPIVTRHQYLERIRPYVDTPIIKVLTGMRRSGKSTLLASIRTQLLPQVKETNIITINFESLEYLSITDAAKFAALIHEKTQGIAGRIYFFFDEVQLVKHWERVINALLVDYDCDIYVTGSNSTLLSGDLATLISGRYVAFEIQPFTFREFCELFEGAGKAVSELFSDYLTLGGMPAIQYFNLETEPTLKYQEDIYNTVIVKDILEYQQIRDVELFNRIVRYAIENIGHVFSANGIRKYLKNEGISISVDSILNYLAYSEQAFIIKKVRSSAVSGKSVLHIDEKYYVTNLGFRSALGFSNVQDIERSLENVVYIELLSRGYTVEIGKVGTLEIDFIAHRGDERAYYQISYMLGDEKTREREFGVYRHVQDNYPKYVLSMDTLNFSQEGIIHKNIVDFLTEEA